MDGSTESAVTVSATLGDDTESAAISVMASTGGLVISVVPVLVLRWIDRREPEPWFMVLSAFLWGGVVAAAVTRRL